MVMRPSASPSRAAKTLSSAFNLRPELRQRIDPDQGRALIRTPTTWGPQQAVRELERYPAKENEFLRLMMVASLS
jgi:hypothetical protein